MSFLLSCPNCGPRDVYEFRFGGEYQKRPRPDAPSEAWVEYLYLRTNEAGAQREWWYHHLGCRAWFLAVRDTRTNAVLEVFRPEETTSEGGSAPLPNLPPEGCAGEAGARQAAE